VGADAGFGKLSGKRLSDEVVDLVRGGHCGEIGRVSQSCHEAIEEKAGGCDWGVVGGRKGVGEAGSRVGRDDEVKLGGEGRREEVDKREVGERERRQDEQRCCRGRGGFGMNEVDAYGLIGRG